MIQILGLRKFTPKGKTKEITYDAFFDKEWRAVSVAEIFLNWEAFVKKIPEKERFNIYYTAAACTGNKREFKDQSVIPFDIDAMDVKKYREYIPVVCKVLGIDEKQIGILFTGNGLHFIVGMKKSFKDVEYFEKNKHHYKEICRKIDAAIAAADLIGKADLSVFCKARILRMPGTKNIKPDKPKRIAKLLNKTIFDLDFDIKKLSGLPDVMPKDQVDERVLAEYPKPDTNTVCKECRFLQHCYQNPNELSESQWYAALSVTSRLENGNQVSHKLSEGYSGYDHSETENKIDQAMRASGPRTCKGISKIWDGCEDCAQWGKVTSPILIVGEDYIKSKDHGFYNVFIENNKLKRGKPNYEDLLKYYDSFFHHIIHPSEEIYVYNGTHYETKESIFIKEFAQTHIKPSPTEAMCNEFLNLVLRSNVKEHSFFTDSTEKKINFQNGYLDFDNGMTLKPHTKNICFTYVLPYAFDPQAKAPEFGKFLNDIICNDKQLADLLLEFAGYCLSDSPCWAEKACILRGEGSNGKSVFMNVLKKVAGRGNYASLTMTDLKKEHNRQMLDGKLFNLAEETPTYSVMESSTFKNLVTGGETQVKKLYKNPYVMLNKAKMLFACNELPKSRDSSHGFFRRLIIIPFNATFEGDDKDPFLIEKLEKELPGIFNLALEGYKRLVKQKKFSHSDAVELEINKYKKEVNTVLSWFDDNVKVHNYIESKNDVGFTRHADMRKGVVMQELYEAYKIDSKNLNNSFETFPVFCKRLANHIPDYIKRRKKKQKDHKRYWVIYGISTSCVKPF